MLDRKGGYLDISSKSIPNYGLYGESGALPSPLHIERLTERAPRNLWSIRPHKHADMYQWVIVERGSAEALLDSRVCQLADGDWVWIPPNIVHAFRFQPVTQGWVVTLPRPYRPGDLPPSLLATPSTGTLTADLRLWIQELERAAVQRHEYGYRLMTHRSEMTFLQLLPHLSPTDNPAGTAVFDNVAHFIRTHLTAELELSEISKACGLSVSRLSRVCKAVTGLPPAKYIEKIRMDEAQRLLAFTQEQIGQVAQRCGYQDPAHFSRVFGRTQGQSPKEYRNQFTQRMQSL